MRRTNAIQIQLKKTVYHKEQTNKIIRQMAVVMKSNVRRLPTRAKGSVATHRKTKRPSPWRRFSPTPTPEERNFRHEPIYPYTHTDAAASLRSLTDSHVRPLTPYATRCTSIRAHLLLRHSRTSLRTLSPPVRVPHN